MEISLQSQTPPSKVFTDRGGSKYDEAIRHTMDNPNEWFRVISVPLEKLSITVPIQFNVSLIAFLPIKGILP